MSRPTISVVVVSWNARDDLRKCLAALPAAAAPYPWEALVVDNASHDGSVDMVRREFPEVRVLARHDNLGFAGGINAGWPPSEGPVIVTLNPDVFAHPGSLALLADLVLSDPAVGLAGPEVVDGRGRVVVQDFRLPSVAGAVRRLPGVAALGRVLRKPSPAPGPRQVERVNGCCMAFRRDALEALGGVPELTFLYGEEIAIGHALARAGYGVRHHPEAQVTHQDGVSVDQLWSAPDKLLVFKAARILASIPVLGRWRSFLWNAILLVRELIYALAGPLARRLGRRWPPVPVTETVELHVLGALAAFSRAAERGVRRRYERYASRRLTEAPAERAMPRGAL